MYDYHVVLTDDTERNIRAKDVRVLESGAALFLNDDNEAVVMYGAGCWRLIEREIRDDRG